MRTAAIVASRSPFAVDVQAGRDYDWCSCGRSAKQPFCDGSHQGTGFAPVRYTADADRTVYFCGCRQSAAGQFCDGAHQKL